MSKENNRDDPFESVTIRKHCARDFLKELDPAHKRWGQYEGLWIYRGQNDAEWQLIPSLLREWDQSTSPLYEISLINLFLSNLNLANLPIPPDSMNATSLSGATRSESLRTTTDMYGDKLVYDFTHVAFAIAQHSGVPTRLLDFTRDPFVAAFFAAETTNLYHSLKLSSEWKEKYFTDILMTFQSNSAAVQSKLDRYLEVIKESEDSLPQEIAVWAVRLDDMRSMTTLRMLQHPYSEIHNLRAQQGVFVCDIALNDLYDQSNVSFNIHLEKLIKSRGVYKLTFPFGRLQELRRDLMKKRYFPGLITPSYASLAKTVKEIGEKYRRLWPASYVR